MFDINSEDDLEDLVLNNGAMDAEVKEVDALVGDEGTGTDPVRGDEDVVYEFTGSFNSVRRAAHTGAKVAKATVQTKMAVDDAIEHRRQINRQARRAKTVDALKILKLVASIFV